MERIKNLNLPNNIISSSAISTLNASSLKQVYFTNRIFSFYATSLGKAAKISIFLVAVPYRWEGVKAVMEKKTFFDCEVPTAI